MEKFILFFRGGTGGEDWSAWVSKIKEKGNFVEGAPLIKDGLIAKSNSDSTDSFIFNIDDNARAYMLIEAENIEEVVRLTKGCPVYSNDGNVTIRPIEELF